MSKKIVISSDKYSGAIKILPELIKAKGYDVIELGAFAEKSDVPNWAEVSHLAATKVADGSCACAVACCFTGTGASISANKVKGVRAALCIDAFSANGARKWNDANVLVISIRLTSEAVLKEIVDAWFETTTVEEEQRSNIARLNH